MALDGDGQRELVDEVHGGARNDGPAAEVLQTEHCGVGQGGVSNDEGSGHGEVKWGVLVATNNLTIR